MDPNGVITQQEWYQWYVDVQQRLAKVNEENKKIEGDIDRRQTRFINREQDFRRNIEEL